jgi:ubiquinone/menaquinone biosynthesis C-methylase UbiE
MEILKPLHHSLTEKYHKYLVIEAINTYAHGRLLDIGCGNKPFLKYTQKHVSEHIGLDHHDSPHGKESVDVFGYADDLPFENSSFDTILLTQVIEHIENPKNVFSEVSRVLKSDGVLIISWPFLYPIHEAPRDFYRYTKYGVTYLSENAGLQIINFKAVSGFWISYFSFLSIYLFGKSKLLYCFMYPFLLIFKILCQLLERIDVNQQSKDKWTWNYCAVMKKP